MKPKAAMLVVGVVWIAVLTSNPLRAQNMTATLSGTVTDSSGKAIPNAKVSIKNVTSGQVTEAQADSAGGYSVPNLAGGDYEVSASAEGVSAVVSKVALTDGSVGTLNVVLSSTPAENLPNAPSATQTEPSKNEPSLEDLGFAPADAQANAKMQALLDKRTHMLKIHQRMGLITTIPLVATVILGPGAGGKSEGTANRDLHVALGAITGDLYGITAWYAIRAPRIKGTEKKGPIRFHEAMAWIHGPGMILTPILGAMAFSQKNNGEKVHGIAAAHGAVAIVTAGAFGAALLSVSVKF